LKFLDADRLLHNFRVAAGIPSDAEPCGGWEKPDIKLRGHSLGHAMSALAQAYAGSGDPVFKEKLDYIVTELAKCQERLPERGNPQGFLSAYSVDQFNELEKLTTYPTIWAPYYTLHKILAGLTAANRLAGNGQALAMARKIADWVWLQLKNVPDLRLQQMWNLYIAGEYGGMNEVLADLYDMTGDRIHLEAARKFDKNRLLVPSSQNRDKLSCLHANQHIPQVTGYLRLFDMTGETEYYEAAKNFWRMVVEHHAFINGGVSEGEMFKDPDKFASFLTPKTCETCCAYNMLKLTRLLFFHEPRARYMDYYERALYNQILASQDPAARHTAVTYFMPLNPGGEKRYSDDYHSFTCCHGTGMENHTKYQESIYSRSHGGDILYVNLYIPSILNWKERGIRVDQETRYPFQGVSTLTIRGAEELKIKLRIPFWIGGDCGVTINGTPQELDITPGTYVTLDRKWRDRDVVVLKIPFSPRLERLPDIRSIGGIMAGPILLVGKSDSRDWIHLNLDAGDLTRSIRLTDKPLEFVCQDITLIPMFKAHHHRYHSYFFIHSNSVE
jgi:DUF1680 family protein